jgi:hypothetical protein
LHGDLGMNKVSVRWIPQLLNPEQKLCRQHICQENLAGLADDEELSSKIITGDETWVCTGIHRQNKNRYMQWVHKTSPPPKKQERSIHQES